MELKDLNVGDKIASVNGSSICPFVVMSKTKYGALFSLADVSFQKVIFLNKESINSQKFIKIEGLLEVLFDFTHCGV
jgi:hypothetical protein